MTQSKPASPGEVIGQLKAGQFATIESFKGGSGSLQARRLANGDVKLYWRYAYESKKLRDEIGLWDSSAPPRSMAPTAKGYSIRAAVEVCRIRAKVHTEEKLSGGWPGHQRRKHEEAATEAQRTLETRQKAAEKAEYSLSKLLDSYCDHLEMLGRRSHADARSIFRLHIKEAWPDFANAPASELTSKQVVSIFRRLIEQKKGRTRNKLRSYLHAAFNCASNVDDDDDVPQYFSKFAVTENPVAVTRRKRAHDATDKNPLTLEELRRYWLALAKQDGLKGAVLRLHLLLGGQRIEQLVKLLRSDVAQDRVVLLDPKGQRKEKALRHQIPLTPAAKREIAILTAHFDAAAESRKLIRESGASHGLKDEQEYVYLISTSGGETHVNAMTFTRWAQEAAKGISDFRPKRIRSGVETALAATGVSKDLRGLLQSHGLSGVQRASYDGHDYMLELKAVLLQLGRLLSKTTPKRKTSQPLRAA